jgi:hypothetical protein
MTTLTSTPPTNRLLRLLVLAFLAGVSVIFASPAGADMFIGSVLALRGDVSREMGTARQALTVHSPIHLGETIASRLGKAKIALTDGSIVSIGENSRLRFVSFRNAPNNLSTRLALIAGALRLFVVKATTGGEFEVETETAVAAVRGTDWIAESTPELTSVAVVNGIVAVRGRVAQSAIVVLDGPGQGTDVRRGQPPTAPRRWPRTRFDAAVARASFE